MGTALASIAACLVLAWLYKVINWVWVKPKRLETCLRHQGLKGNSYRFLYGDTKDNLKMILDASSKPILLSDDIAPRVDPYLNLCLRTYGKNFIMWMGPKPRVNVMDPELIKDVFNKINDFQKPAVNPLVALLTKGFAIHNGDKWAKHRKLINPVFHSEKLKSMMPAFYHSSNDMVSKWEKLTLDSADGSCELDVWPDLQNLTRNVIARTAFGSSYEEGKRIFELQTELSGLVMQALVSVYIPGWRFVPTKMNRRMKALEREIKASLRFIINKKEEALKEGKAASDDLLGLLLESNLKEMKEHKNKKDVGMSLDEVIEECKLFYFAGQESTSAMLVWTMILLSQHQEWQRRARDEVLQVFGTEKPYLEGLNHLKVVTMILHEALRLYPPGILVNRETRKETVLGNLTLPAGVMVSVPILSIQRDPDIWGEDANEFKPERFSQGVFNATKGQVTFLPFTWGPRICIGQNFSLLEGKMAVALVLKTFTFELSPSYTHAPYNVISLQPQHGAHLILHKF
uniref:Cytochrome P450 n=1 Tax=Kalanchoe fedtschenkoi TaxID=63787 RepID=A0A7N0TJB2_KALFE